MTHASVFSGIGGPEVAAAMLGWENLFHCEINPFGRAVLEYWFPNSKSYEDITKTDFSEWSGRVNVLTGGFPCQPFSYAGQRRGTDDDRYLWPYMHKCIDQIRPDWVVCENVAGILTMVEQGDVTEMATEKSLFEEGDTLYRYRLEETFTLERICNDLEGDGYAVQAVVIPACAVNAPHRRDRVFIIGHRIVADTDNGADGRTTRKNEGESSAQRLQERHEVRQPDEPNQVRPTAEGYVPDPIRTGLERQDQPRCGQGGQRVHLWRDPARCHRQDDAERTTTTDTDCRGEGTPRQGRGTESNRSDQDKLTEQRGEEAKRDDRLHAVLRPIAYPSLMHLNGCQSGDGCNGSRQPQPEFGSGDCTTTERRITADTESGRAGGLRNESETQRSRLCDDLLGVGSGLCRKTDIAGCGRWSTFPTVSPVHRGNDGLPFSLDDLTIPPSKWRTESLKAYGNAIVPQVMYEIFRAIESTYQ